MAPPEQQKVDLNANSATTHQTRDVLDEGSRVTAGRRDVAEDRVHPVFDGIEYLRSEGGHRLLSSASAVAGVLRQQFHHTLHGQEGAPRRLVPRQQRSGRDARHGTDDQKNAEGPDQSGAEPTSVDALALQKADLEFFQARLSTSPLGCGVFVRSRCLLRRRPD
ncbi:unnamed protein product [Ixodes pacificus]